MYTKKNYKESIIKWENKTFCSLPFLSINAHLTWAYWLCWADFDIKDNFLLWKSWDISISEMRNSDLMKEIRKKMLRWKKVSYCRWCDKNQDMEINSCRDSANKTFKKYRDDIIQNTDFDTWETTQIVKYIDVRFSNTCNLACRMCWWEWSTWKKKFEKALWHKTYPHYKNFWNENSFNSIIEDVEIIYIAWWEPFLDKKCLNFLLHLIEKGYSKKIFLSINTNLTQLNMEVIEILRKFKNIQCIVSCDGFGNSYEYIRIWSSWSTFMKKFKILLSTLPTFWEGSLISINMVVQISNIYSLWKVILFCDKLDIKLNITLLQLPKNMSIGILSRAKKADIKEYYLSFIQRHKATIPNLEWKLKELFLFLDYTKENKTLFKNYLREMRIIDKNL